MSPSKDLGIKKTSTNSGADRRAERIKRLSPSEWYAQCIMMASWLEWRQRRSTDSLLGFDLVGHVICLFSAAPCTGINKTP